MEWESSQQVDSFRLEWRNDVWSPFGPRKLFGMEEKAADWMGPFEMELEMVFGLC